MSIQPVILCGGEGSRLWPVSRSTNAKPFFSVNGLDNLITETLERVHSDSFDHPVIVCGRDHAQQIVENSLASSATILVEDAPQGTAAAIALAVAFNANACPADGLAHSEVDLMLTLPSDHNINDVAAFHAAISQGGELARQGWIVCLGITPTEPKTSFGYIGRGERLTAHGYAATGFTEKPPLSLAKALIASGRSLWNAGIFLFQPQVMRDALQRMSPNTLSGAEVSVSTARHVKNCVYCPTGLFEGAPRLSIDHAVMEHCERIAVVPVDMGWSDVGSWDAVYAITPQTDGYGNALSGDVFAHDSKRNLVRAGGKRVSLIGVDDLAVIVDGEDILILPLSRAQDTRLAAQAREQA